MIDLSPLDALEVPTYSDSEGTVWVWWHRDHPHAIAYASVDDVLRDDIDADPDRDSTALPDHAADVAGKPFTREALAEAAEAFVAEYPSVVRVAVYMTIRAADFKDGWNDDASELEGSVKATLHELNGDDGNVYAPTVLGIQVEDD